MTVEGLNSWTAYRVTAKRKGSKERIFSMRVIAPTGNDAIEACKKFASGNWFGVDTADWNAKAVGGYDNVKVVHYV